METLATLVLLSIAFVAFAAKRAMTYMHIYQQEEYDSSRFFPWMMKNKVFDKRLSLIVLAAYGLSFYVPAIFVYFLIFIGMAFTTYIEPDPRKDSKKKLVATLRAKRIFFPAYLIVLLSASWVFVMPEAHWLWVINIHLIPFAIMFVNLMLSPYEEMNNARFWREAHNKVLDYRPTVIGITGSFGKTSVKHILGHILKKQAPTLITPGSVNTPMGITRIIREQLEPDHKFLVVEMGAYGKGSIARLCKLTPPNIGIISAIGHAHYERFKSLDMVAETKYELAEAVLANSDDGQMIVHERTLRFDHARRMRDLNTHRFISIGEGPNVTPMKNGDPSYLNPGDLKINLIDQRANGLEVRFTWKKVEYNVEAPLFGLHHGHNVALAFAAAFEMGISSADIQAALHSVPQIQHRLEVRKQSGGLTIIDDAYNSNPVGFHSALDLLPVVSKGRKILITPGMVELGKAHDEAHRKVGEYAGQVCDIAIVIKSKRIPTFIQGYKSTAGSKPLHEVNTFQDAQNWIAKNQQNGDVILLENDLPDLYERVPRM